MIIAKNVGVNNSKYIYKSIADIGLYLMILDNSIHRRDVVVARATPAQPSSSDQAVEKSLAARRGAAAARDPATPSVEPSA